MEHVPSILPAGKKWQLVWHDEFDGTELDKSKWGFRRHLLQHEHKTFCGEEGLEFRGDSCVHFKRLKKDDGEYYSCQLQTGSNFLDAPGEVFYEVAGHADAPQHRWPIAKLQEPKFLHKFGYYEIRCKLQKRYGWWSAFWLQSPIIGCCNDPRIAGVEVDIMEYFKPENKLYCNNHWGGYGPDHKHDGNANREPYLLEDTTDDFHIFGCDWSPDGYVYYADGKQVWRCAGPVSHQEQFILVSTECNGYRRSYHAAPELQAETVDDEFVVDYVRVYDEIK